MQRYGRRLEIALLLVAISVWTACSTDRRIDNAEKRDPVASSAPFTASLHGDQVSQWTPLKGATVSFASRGGHPVMLAILPVSQQLTSGESPAAIMLYVPKNNIVNEWQIDIVRDSTFRIGEFSVGNAMSSYSFIQQLPLSLVVVDAPDKGLHTYVVRAKYIGTQNGGLGGAMEIVDARLIAIEL